MARAKVEDKATAKRLYMSGTAQKDIARLINVSEKTLSKWVKDGNWQDQRASKFLSVQEVQQKVLHKIAEDIDAGEFNADKMMKSVYAMRKLGDAENSPDVIMSVFTNFNKWLVNRAKIDSTLTAQDIELINKWDDLYIEEIYNAYKNSR